MLYDVIRVFGIADILYLVVLSYDEIVPIEVVVIAVLICSGNRKYCLSLIGVKDVDLFCDVVNKSASARASRLSEELEGLSAEEREKVLDVVETMIKNAK